ncbi:MAG TPA: MFS transporter [Candidatus Limnocylindria bacterium]|nr:MFS transporter [Candidatus Limnocylindria bacterium]
MPNARIVIALSAAILILDGLDAQVVGFVAPALAKELGVGPQAIAPVFSLGLFGLMLGALLLGPLADRVGRKPVLVGSVLAFGALSALTFFAHSLTALVVLRFLTGLGLGGAMPNAVALTAEYVSERRRSTAVMSIFAGFSLGAAIGGSIAAHMIPAFGWRSVFLLGGALPLVLAPMLIAWLPESARWQLHRGAPETPRVPVAGLFASGRTVVTALLWVAFFTNLLALYFCSSWLPTVLVNEGYTLPAAVAVAALFQYGGVAGALLLGWPADRYHPSLVIGSTLAAGVAFVLLIGHVAAGPLVPLLVTLMGFCIVGGQNGLNGLAARSYPTILRSTGVGWSLGIGRIGSIVGPLIGGALLANHATIASIFSVIAIPLALCAASAYGVRRPAGADEPALGAAAAVS